jgi:hypothetical protein
MPEIITTEITATKFFNGVHYASCPETVKGKRFEGTDFIETDFSTGQNSTGRLYYRNRNGSVEMLISEKQRQSGDYQWLRRQ